TLVLHGTIDEVVPITQADALARRLLELGVPFTYDRLDGWPHAIDLAEAVRPRCEFIVDWFLDRHLPLRR
ncbi:MAG: alpha/beta hydrolase family protein, partial [Limisphaerales bacterium]